MQAFGSRDALLYVLLTTLYIFSDNSFFDATWFIFSNISVFIQVPYLYLCNRYFLPFPLQTRVSQRATGAEFILINLLRLNLNHLSKRWGKEFFKTKVFYYVNRWRYLREAGNGLGDVMMQEYSDGGCWFQSQSKNNRAVDLAIVYVHGSWIVGGSIAIYEEYLTSFCVKLQEEGFQNPIVFAPSISTSSELDLLLPSAVSKVRDTVGEDCHVVLAGDSIGATLIMNSLLMEDKESLPAVALLVSPITQLDQFDQIESKINTDYLSIENIEGWLEEKVIELNCCAPGKEKWSLESIPKFGIVISYGSEECVSGYTEDYISKLKNIDGCKLKVDKQVAQVHNWAIINYYTERLVEHREESLQKYASIISRLLLSETKSYFEDNGGKVKSMISLDEERV
ncbi:hypothetical protein CLIB1423_18S00606 [[Candida] railenensis]|uniref:Alpha/beta hydrolase fold-3 domain-containing protein n=1 Tax=[Candida] railenensis TaxID=45579 RepID=A0A9P0QU74_9ASCO|nr:hypothetical protein CLIB1423_18S00606 [[Candida] railenensis]